MKIHKQLKFKSIFAVLALAGTVLFSGCADITAAIPEETKKQAESAIEDAINKAVSEAVSQAVENVDKSDVQDEKEADMTASTQTVDTPKEKENVQAVENAVKSDVQDKEEELWQEQTVSYKFRSKKLLSQHYDKHGKDMGFSDMKSYEKAASDVINNPKALTKTEKEDGDYVYYLEETNEFVILSTDGYIRTYFLPDSGKKYYDKQ